MSADKQPQVMVTTTVQLEPEQHDKLSKMAIRQKTSLVHQIRKAVAEYTNSLGYLKTLEK